MVREETVIWPRVCEIRVAGGKPKSPLKERLPCFLHVCIDLNLPWLVSQLQRSVPARCPAPPRAGSHLLPHFQPPSVLFSHMSWTPSVSHHRWGLLGPAIGGLSCRPPCTGNISVSTKAKLILFRRNGNWLLISAVWKVIFLFSAKRNI